MNLIVRTDGVRLTLEVGIKPEIRAAADTELPPDYPPAAIGLLPGDGDEYILTEGGMQGPARLFHPRRAAVGDGGRPRRPAVHHALTVHRSRAAALVGPNDVIASLNTMS